MKCKILHESNGRLRVRILRYRMTYEQADRLEYFLRSLDGVTKVNVNDRTLDAVIFFNGHKEGVRDCIVKSLSSFDIENTEVEVPTQGSREISRQYEDKLFFLAARRVITRFVLPTPISTVYTALRAAKYIAKGLSSLGKGQLDVPVLDATSISAAMLMGDFVTAGSVMFLLDIGELLEEWTHKKSVDDLAQRMYLNVDKVWIKSGESEVLVGINQVKPGDEIVVRTGNMIPLDGEVTSGEASVNQSSMTGESLPVFKNKGASVFAGTVVEDGECVIRVTKALGAGRYDKIVGMIEDSEKLKSLAEMKAFRLADGFVPWSLGGTVLTYLLTGNATKAMSILMVDFSCALKLSMPIAVMSAMRECGEHHIDVKGGKFLEAVSEATTIVFDKTGTLTDATPKVAKVVPFGGEDEAEMLRLAACLEEHFPHSMANAVVEEAERRGLDHAEKHTKVEYIVAHGIASTIDGEKVCIGSHHFIFEDESCVVLDEDRPVYDSISNEYTKLFLAVGGVLKAIVCVEDPVREEVSDVIRELHEVGFKKVVMMTGDSRKTAAAVAAKIGLDEYYGEVLPEDKANFIKKEHEKGKKVVMIGDGINDSPALSEADVGIAIAAGAAIAREVADITISASDLHELIVLKRIADALTGRISQNYRGIMGFNSLLILLGVLGVLAPATTSLMHNSSTILFGLQSMTNLLPADES